jgi:hypothetical protein
VRHHLGNIGSPSRAGIAPYTISVISMLPVYKNTVRFDDAPILGVIAACSFLPKFIWIVGVTIPCFVKVFQKIRACC